MGGSRFLLHSFTSGHLGGFHLLAVVRNAAVGMGVQILIFFPPKVNFIKV